MTGHAFVRRVNQSDASSIIDLLDKHLSPYRPEYIDYQLEGGANQHRIVVEINNKVVGHASLLIEVNARGGKLGHIEDVVISSLFQGQGLGRILIESLENIARREGCYKLGMASTESAEKFYESIGYNNTARYFTKIL